MKKFEDIKISLEIIDKILKDNDFQCITTSIITKNDPETIEIENEFEYTSQN